MLTVKKIKKIKKKINKLFKQAEDAIYLQEDLDIMLEEDKTEDEYSVFIFKDGKSWVVFYPDLPGCIACGETPTHALKEGFIAKSLYLDTYKEHNEDLPVAYKYKVVKDQ